MMTTAAIALGSNRGDRHATLDAALDALSRRIGRIVAVSTYRETAPIGGPAAQGPFLNAVALIETPLDPVATLDTLLAIEANQGRVRVVRWGERTLDLDLLLHGPTVLRSPRLTLPHPRMAVRRFVLEPLAEIAPGAIHPETGRTSLDLLDRLDLRTVALVGWPVEVLTTLRTALPYSWSAWTGTEVTPPSDLAFAFTGPGAPSHSTAIPRDVPMLRADPGLDPADELRAACLAAS